MSAANRIVQQLLSSPLHRVLSASTALIRYTGTATGQVHVTPVQYARYGSAVVIAVAHPEAKAWWRNFRHDHPIDLLIAGTWISMTGSVVDPTEHPDEAVPLIDAYRARFPRAAAAFGPTGDDRALLIWCRPRPE